MTKTSLNVQGNVVPFRLLASMLSLDLPEGGISVEVANNIRALLDLAEKVFLTGDFSVLPMAFRQQFLWKTKFRRVLEQDEYAYKTAQIILKALNLYNLQIENPTTSYLLLLLGFFQSI